MCPGSRIRVGVFSSLRRGPLGYPTASTKDEYAISCLACCIAAARLAVRCASASDPTRTLKLPSREQNVMTLCRVFRHRPVSLISKGIDRVLPPLDPIQRTSTAARRRTLGASSPSSAIGRSQTDRRNVGLKGVALAQAPPDLAK